MMDDVGGSRGSRSEETSPDVTETVQQAASSTADSVQQVAASAAGSVQDVASSIADTAQEAVSGVVDKVQDVTDAVSEQANRVTDAAANQVENLANTVYQQAAAPGAPAIQRNVAETTVNVLDRTAEYLRAGDARLILEDLRASIRRHPGRSLLLGLGLGYLARSTFFGGGTAQSQGGSQRSQPFAPRSQAVPVYGSETYSDVDVSYSSPSTLSGMSGSTLSSDMAIGADLGIPQSSLSSSSEMATGATTFAGTSDSGLGLSGTMDTEGVSGDFSDVGLSGSAIGSSSDFTGGDIGTTFAPSDTSSVMDDDLTGSATLDSDDVFVAGTGVADTDLTDDLRTLGGEDFRSDTSSTDTMPSDDLLSRWDAETRKPADES